MGRKPQYDDNNEVKRSSINVRNVEDGVWNEFKKLAMLRDLSIQEYLKYLVEQDKKHVKVQISKN